MYIVSYFFDVYIFPEKIQEKMSFFGYFPFFAVIFRFFSYFMFYARSGFGSCSSSGGIPRPPVALEGPRDNTGHQVKSLWSIRSPIHTQTIRRSTASPTETAFLDSRNPSIGDVPDAALP